MIGKEKFHFDAPKSLSRNNQAHLKNKSSSGQSLTGAFSASSAADLDRDLRDRNGDWRRK
jgi:hypothetical protein